MRLDQDLFYNISVMLLHQHDDGSIKIANEFVKLYRENKNPLTEEDKQIVELYIDIIKDILDYGLEIVNIEDENDLINKQKSIDTKGVLNKFITNPITIRYPSIIKNLVDMIDNRLSSNTVRLIKEDLMNSLLYKRGMEYVKKMFGYLNAFNNNVDLKQRNDQMHLFKSITDDLSVTVEASHMNTDESNKGIEYISLTDESDMNKGISDYYENTINKGFTTGLQGLNNTMDPNGKFTLGHTVVFAALSSNFKSSMLIHLSRWLIDHNDMSQFGKNILLPFFTLENRANYNAMKLFQMFYANANKDDPDFVNRMKKVTPSEVVKFVKNHLEKKNIHFVIERHNPSEFSHTTFESRINHFLKVGYTVPATFLDYAALMDGGQYSNLAQWLCIQKQFNYICNIGKQLEMTIFTGHQLNRAAADQVNMVTDPIKNFSEAYLSLSQDVHREVDMLYFLHIETLSNNKRYLSMRKYKDRYNELTPEDKKICTYELKPVIGLEDDVGMEFQGYNTRAFSKLRSDVINSNNNSFGSTII